jgi:hypothetical protein
MPRRWLMFTFVRARSKPASYRRERAKGAVCVCPLRRDVCDLAVIRKGLPGAPVPQLVMVDHRWMADSVSSTRA